jgi:hypothetical protein
LRSNIVFGKRVHLFHAMTIRVALDHLTEDEAWALAQLCKRLLWDDRLSANRLEHEDMLDRATHKLRRQIGYEYRGEKTEKD